MKDQETVSEMLLDLHRHMYPEKHVGYWNTRPRSEWPEEWNGPGHFLTWDTFDIERVGEALTEVLKIAGLPIVEPGTEDYTFKVTVTAATREQAVHVMTERLNPDEDYGFFYALSWREKVVKK